MAGRVAPELKQTVRDHERRERVRSLGFRPSVAPLFHSADVFVFPTLEEGGPQVTYEAAGCGLPVITTPMGAARLVESGRTGIVVEPGSVEHLADAIRLLADRPDLRADVRSGSTAPSVRVHLPPGGGPPLPTARRSRRELTLAITAVF